MSPTRSPNAPKCHTTNLLRVAPFTTEICVADRKTTFSLYTLCLPISLFRWFFRLFLRPPSLLSLPRLARMRTRMWTWRRTKSASSVNRQCLCSHKAKKYEPPTVVSSSIASLWNMQAIKCSMERILALAIFILSGLLLRCI